jgi:hypothetical protein
MVKVAEIRWVDVFIQEIKKGDLIMRSPSEILLFFKP